MPRAFDASSRFATGGTITLTDRVGVYDYKKYTDRMLGLSGDSPTMVDGSIENGENWKWPGEAGHSMVGNSTPMPFKRLPRRTKDSVERLGFKNSGETIDIQTVLWAGDDLVWNRGKFQAVKFSYNGKDAFSWVVYDNNIYYEPPANERIIHEITDDELINGFTPKHGERYKLIFPAILVKAEKQNLPADVECEFILTGKNGDSIEYQKSITVNNTADESPYLEVYFKMTPRKFLYTLECNPKDAVDKDGKKMGKYTIFQDKPYGK